MSSTTDLLDRVQFDGAFVPRTSEVDADLVAEFRREAAGADLGQGGAASSSSGGGDGGGGGRGGDNGDKQDFDENYDDLVDSTQVDAGNYWGQVKSRRQTARFQFRDMLVRTGGVITRRSLAYFLGLGLNDVMVDDNPVAEPTVLAMLCKNPDVSAASVRLAASFLEDVDFDSASEATDNLTPLGLAIVGAVRAQETDAKVQTFGDNAVEKVRVLLEHDAWVCRLPEENARGGDIEMVEFLERLESGRENVESLDLVAIDKLKTIAAVQKKKRDAFIKAMGGASASGFDNIATTNQAPDVKIRTGGIETNPVFDSFSSAVGQGQLEGFFELLKTKREWDVYVDNTENEYRLPLVWFILKRITNMAMDQAQDMKSVPLGEDRSVRLACPAFDMLLHWYLNRKVASNAFKFDSIACVFWYCVGAWRLLGANNYDIDLDDKSPFPLMDLVAPSRKDVVDDPSEFASDFFYTQDGTQSAQKYLGANSVVIAERKAREKLSVDLRKITDLLNTKHFIRFLENSVTKLNDLEVPSYLRKVNLGNSTLGSAAQQGGLDVNSVRRIRPLPENISIVYFGAFREELGRLLNIPSDTTNSKFFFDLSRHALSGNSDVVTQKLSLLHDALLKLKEFHQQISKDDATISVLAVEERVPIDSNASVHILLVQPGGITYHYSAVLTILQYGLLEQLARFSHHKAIRYVAEVMKGMGVINTAQTTEIPAHLETIRNVLNNMAKEFTFYRIVSGALALSLGVSEQNGKSQLSWGKTIGHMTKTLALADTQIVKPAIQAFDDAVSAYSDNFSDQMRNELLGLLTSIKETYIKITDAPDPENALIGASIAMTSVVFKMPFSSDDVAPSYPIRYKAELFKVIASLSTVLKTHQEHVFANSVDFSTRLDTRDPGDIWPRIPGALM